MLQVLEVLKRDLFLGSKLAKLEAKVIGIDIIGKPELPRKILKLARETAENMISKLM